MTGYGRIAHSAPCGGKQSVWNPETEFSGRICRQASDHQRGVRCSVYGVGDGGADRTSGEPSDEGGL